MARWLYFGAGGSVSNGVSLGGGVTTLSSSNNVTRTLAGVITPSTGDLLVRLFYTDNGSIVLPLTVTLGGVTVTRRAGYDPEHGGTNRGAACWIGTVRGVSTASAANLVITSSGTAGIGKVIVRTTNLNNWGGTVGNAAASGVDGTNAVSASSGAATLAGTGSLLVGVGGAANADCTPLAVAGWTVTEEATVGTTAGQSSDAAFFTKTGGNAGTAASATVSSATTWTQWACAILELR